MYDIVIKDALVVDGSGSSGFVADVAVENGTVVEIGLVNGAAVRTIDAAGLVAAPGFIDIHTHLDPQITWDPYATPSMFHGVTTVIAGNCGLSVAPCRRGRGENLIMAFAKTEAMDADILKEYVPWTWETMGEYLAQVEQRGIGVNFGLYAGHSALREYILGDEAVERQSTKSEVNEMKQLLRQCLLDGALGLSTTVSPRHERTDGKPVPSRLAAPEEFWELGTVLAELNRGVLQMSEGIGRTPEKAKFVSDKSRELRRPVIGMNVRHFWERPDAWKDILYAVQDGLREGSRSFAQTSTRQFVHRFDLLKDYSEFNEFPTWHELMQSSVDKRMQAFRDPNVREKLRFEIVDDPTPTTFAKRWDLIYVAQTFLDKNKKYEGKSIEQIAKDNKSDILDTFLDLSLSEGLKTLFTVSTSQGDPVAVAEIIASPATVMGQSDAGAHVGVDCGCEYSTLMLSKWVREEHLLSLETAVRMLTFDQARLFEIQNRGLLTPGYAADVVLFDADTVAPLPAHLVRDLPGGGQRYVQDAVGLPTVIVNGDIVVDEGRLTSALPGQIIRSAPISS